MAILLNLVKNEKRVTVTRAKLASRQRETRQTGIASYWDAPNCHTPYRNAPNWDRVILGCAKQARAKLPRAIQKRAKLARNRRKGGARAKPGNQLVADTTMKYLVKSRKEGTKYVFGKVYIDVYAYI